MQEHPGLISLSTGVRELTVSGWADGRSDPAGIRDARRVRGPDHVTELHLLDRLPGPFARGAMVPPEGCRSARTSSAGAKAFPRAKEA
ncbi:hypothetical protein AB0H45_14020 [Streptomyces atroolivaceus]|uniref:hypothetical protein n=1 Tax=Streptomyces atroolivaceus TaxID=66869 RepID=UPI003406A458